MSRIDSQQSSNIIYVKKEVYDIVVNQLLIKINTLEKKVNRLQRDNSAADTLYRKMDQLLIQLKSNYKTVNDYDYGYNSD